MKKLKKKIKKVSRKAKRFVKSTVGAFTFWVAMASLLFNFFIKIVIWAFNLPENVSDGMVYGTILWTLGGYVLLNYYLAVSVYNAAICSYRLKLNFREQIIIISYILLMGETSLRSRNDAEEFSEFEPEVEETRTEARRRAVS